MKSTPSRSARTRLLDHVAEDVGLRQPLPVGVDGDVAEGVEAQFNGVWHGHSGWMIGRGGGVSDGRGGGRLIYRALCITMSIRITPRARTGLKRVRVW